MTLGHMQIENRYLIIKKALPVIELKYEKLPHVKISIYNSWYKLLNTIKYTVKQEVLTGSWSSWDWQEYPSSFEFVYGFDFTESSRITFSLEF